MTITTSTTSDTVHMYETLRAAAEAQLAALDAKRIAALAAVEATYRSDVTRLYHLLADALLHVEPSAATTHQERRAREKHLRNLDATIAAWKASTAAIVVEGETDRAMTAAHDAITGCGR